MTISKDLFLSILAMDAYSQGYDAAIEHGFDKIGSASRGKDAQQLLEQGLSEEAGFYALSYNIGFGVEGINAGTTVPSFRGTDYPLEGDANKYIDLLRGWFVGAGDGLAVDIAKQDDLTIAFYEAALERSIFDAGTGDNVTITGHSLGGGLAGYASLISGADAVGFDHMPIN
ncbi:MAG: hypothetical protein AAF826_08230 [Pseudomonadota bacterium]